MSASLVKERSNEEWLQALSDPISSEALDDLRATLLRGLRAALSSRVDGDLEAVTEDFVQDALLKILASLHTFRGESRFTTWAQKIAIHVAFSELRRLRWKDISLQELVETPEGDEYTPAILTDPDASPELHATQQDILQIVETLVMEELTDRQRTAMLAMLQGNMPISEVAKRMDSNPNALYKLLHDARKRLLAKLEEKAGLSAQEVLAIFNSQAPRGNTSSTNNVQS
ncbi:MAG: RNA polymerase sigma factor [Chloroflexi bacterium]|nr:RNA polymerase sigma factor [Chloroflexota bacterium]